ncbi:DUF4102 domain-containing protein [Vibrio harveyi]
MYFRIARKKSSWVVRYVIAGKRAQIALPQSFPTLSISEARVQAINIRQQVKIGIDPKSERKKLLCNQFIMLTSYLMIGMKAI